MANRDTMFGAPQLPKMELIPPKEAEVEGIFRDPNSPHHNRIIYTERVVDVEATKASGYKQRLHPVTGEPLVDPVTGKPILDLNIKIGPDGKEVWKRHKATNEPQYPVLVKEVKYKTRRYVLFGNEISRSVKRVYHFEPTAEELLELARREKERNFLEDFVRAAVDAGMSPGQLVQKIKSDLAVASDAPADSINLDVEPELTDEVVAEAMAKIEAEQDLMGRPDDEEDVIGVEPGTHVQPEPSPLEEDALPRPGHRGDDPALDWEL